MAPNKPSPSPAPRAAERVMHSASELFYREGIRAIGVEEIVHHAGVTKPSLYRSYASKDELAAAYLRDYDAGFWQRYDAVAADHPGDPKGQLLDYFARLARRADCDGYRGCGFSNAMVEFPQAEHPARQVAQANKQQLRERLHALSEAMGARDPAVLGDGLLLLLEGAYASGQAFGKDGPAGQALVKAAAMLIEASVG